MINKNINKLTEDFIKVQIQEVDNIFLQEEFAEMQDTITKIIQELEHIDKSRVEIIFELLQICNKVLDEIKVNMQGQQL